MNRLPHTLLAAAALALLAPGPGCSSTSIALKERLGIPKREQLVARVKDARDEQQEAKEQFRSALEQFLAVTGAASNTGVAELEQRYTRLKKEYDRSEAQAGDVRKRIQSVRDVAEALFKEWKAELAQYSSDQLRRASQQQLADTRAQYDRLTGAMKAAERKMDPVLGAFRDQVLFLKHNLNARAIASLQGNAEQMQSEIGALIREMETSIAEANSFIEQMQAGG